MFGFFKKRRRRTLLAEPFPAAWQAVLHRDVGLYAPLDTAERARLRDEVRFFVAEKGWEAARGFEITDPMKVMVAANACLMTLAMNGDPLRHVRTIIIHPASYTPPRPTMVGGVARDGVQASGTAYVHGPVVLSWRDVLHGSRNPDDGRNVVIHEFAHQLDMIGGIVDGTPPLGLRSQYPAWQRVMTDEYRELVDAAERGERTFLNQYGATNPAEFFAVASEYFFERPVGLRDRHPELYAVLRAYYRQDTARRAESPGDRGA